MLSNYCRTGKATDFKFGRYIYRVHPSKSLLKISRKRDRGRIQGLPNFWGYPLLSQERVKPRTSNLADTLTGSIRVKAVLKISRKGTVIVSMDSPIFGRTPYYLRNG